MELKKFLHTNLTFHACLALNYAAFGLKLLKLGTNRVLPVRLAKVSMTSF